jgi:glycosyltransferase involved in cell wall biosynthesis
LNKLMTIYLSIVVPVYNEEDSIERLVEAILNTASKFTFSYEIILVDDGSDDRTWNIIEKLKAETEHLRALKFRRNFGQTSAMVAGFDHARGQLIVTMDADLQNDPADIPLLLAKMEEGYDIVSGWRKDRQDSYTRVLPSQIANAIISLTTGVCLHDYGCSLKAYRSECIKSLHAYGEMHRFFPAIASMTGARVAEIPVSHHPRRFGVSKYGFDRILKVFSDIFAMNLIIRFSSTPLKGFAVCALPFILLILFFGLLAGVSWLYEWTAGKTEFFLVLSALSAMGIVHMIALGIIGELVVSTGDLSHTQLPEITKKSLAKSKYTEKSGLQPELTTSDIFN